MFDIKVQIFLAAKINVFIRIDTTKVINPKQLTLKHCFYVLIF